MPGVAVVGGGPAGLMAAETIAAAGSDVTVYDHRRSPGRKLVLAGRSGLNLTHAEELGVLLGRYIEDGSRIADAVRAFPPESVRDWSAQLGQPTFTGSTGRVFPEAMRATPLLRLWIRRLAESGVQFRLGHRFDGWSESDDLRFETSVGEVTVAADAVVFAVGGASWPGTGSDARWVAEFRSRGVEVRPMHPSNCGVVVDWSDHFVERFEGMPLKNVALSIGGERRRGDPIITRSGLESGPVYQLSALIRHALAACQHATLECDLQPDRSCAQLAQHLETKRRPKDSFSTWLRRSGVEPAAVGLLRETTNNHPPSRADELAEYMKTVPIRVRSLAPIDRAISTAGGIAMREVDATFMLTQMPGTFVAGEMLDWDAPTGGYLLQACMSTGVAAGRGVIEYVAA